MKGLESVQCPHPFCLDDSPHEVNLPRVFFTLNTTPDSVEQYV
jgi:hypothetical protein